MSKRPGLSKLASRLSTKGQAAASEEVATSPEQDERGIERRQKRGSQPDGRKGVLLRLKPDAWFQLKSMAAEQTISRGEIYTMQSALEEAVNDWFRKHGKPPIA